MIKSFSYLAGLLGLFCVIPNSYAKFDASGFIELEAQFFTQEANPVVEEAIGFEQGDSFASIASELDIYWRSENEAHALQFKPFGRITTAEEGARDHADIRELYYRFAASSWQVLVGANKVFWGVTESAHLVDIINQTDAVESFSGEEKLGQPMVALGLEQAWGNLDVYVLPYFRERKFTTGSERYQVPLPINDQVVQYQDEDEEKNIDYAARWSHYFGSLDIAVSYFSGTNREPLPIFSNLNITTQAPTESSYAYEQLKQAGLELQYLFDGLALKFEGVHKRLDSGNYSEAVMGFEYTWGDLGESGFDIGLLAEYLWNDRETVDIKRYTLAATSETLNQDIGLAFASLPAAQQASIDAALTGVNGELLSPFNNDIFIGARFSLNDVDSTQFLAGVISDADTQESLVTFEGSRRFGNSLKVSLNIYLLTNISDDAQKSAFASLQQDDAIEAKLKWYF